MDFQGQNPVIKNPCNQEFFIRVKDFTMQILKTGPSCSRELVPLTNRKLLGLEVNSYMVTLLIIDKIAYEILQKCMY